MPKFKFTLSRSEYRAMDVIVEAADEDAAERVLTDALCDWYQGARLHRYLDGCDSNSTTEIEEPYDTDTEDGTPTLQDLLNPTPEDPHV